MHDSNQAPLVTETLLKKRRSLEELAVVRAETVQNQVKRRRVVRGESVRITRPEQIVKARRIIDGSRNKLERKKSQVYAAPSKALPDTILPTVGFVVRIHEARNSAQEVKRTLCEMGLRKKYDAVFFKLDEAGFGELVLLFFPLFAYRCFSLRSTVEANRVLCCLWFSFLESCGRTCSSKILYYG